MVEVRQSGGMVKHIGMGELNALPFFCAYSAKGRDKIVKTVEYTWPLCAPCTELESADIVAVILIYLALAHIQKRATY